MDRQTLEELNKSGGPIELTQEKRLVRALLYGDPGSGKTTMAAKCVEDKGIIVTTDSAWTVLLKEQNIAKKIIRKPFEGFAQLRAIAQAHAEGIEPYASCDTLIWDTYSTAVDITLRRLVDAKKYPKEQNDPEVEGWPHYRICERKLRDTVVELSASGLNIFYLAHIRDPKAPDKEKKRFAIRPNGPEASFNIVAQEVQLIGWLYKEQRGSERKIQLEGTLQETAKSQIPGINETTYPVDAIPNLIQLYKNREM